MNYDIIEGSVLQNNLGNYISSINKIKSNLKYKVYIEPEEISLSDEHIKTVSKSIEEYKSNRGTHFNSVEDAQKYIQDIIDSNE